MRTLTFLSIFLFTHLAYSNTWGLYGLGARQISTGNSGFAVRGDSFSQVYNPALMARVLSPELSIGFQGAYNKFRPIDNVIVDTPDLGSSSTSPTRGNVDTKTPDLLLTEAAFQMPLRRNTPDSWNLGFYFVSPVDKAMTIDTQDTWVPQYSAYSSDAHRFSMGVNVAKKVTDWLDLGFGVDLFLVQSASTIVRLNNTNSNGRLKMDVKPGLAPALGAVFHADDQWKIGLAYHGEQNHKMQLDLNSVLSIVGTTPLVLESRSSLFYDPQRYSLGISHVRETVTYTVAAQYEKWSAFDGTDMRLTFKTLSFVQRTPARGFSDIINLRAGFEHRCAESTISAYRLGYAFLPTPYPELSGENNMIDADKHMITTGLGIQFPQEWLETKAGVDIAFFSQILKEKTVVKTNPNFVGADGYTVGGFVLGAAATFNVEF